MKSKNNSLAHKPQYTVICEQDNTITCQKMRVAELFSILFHMKLFVGAKALIVRVGDVLGIYESFATIKGEDSHIIRVYYAAYLDSEVAITLSADHDIYEWVSLEDLADKKLVSNLEQLVHKVLG